jgi:hypothetical protein
MPEGLPSIRGGLHRPPVHAMVGLSPAWRMVNTPYVQRPEKL